MHTTPVSTHAKSPAPPGSLTVVLVALEELGEEAGGVANTSPCQ